MLNKIFTTVSTLFFLSHVAYSQTMLSDSDKAVVKLADTSECAKYRWERRGVSYEGFVKGVALTYSKAYCDAKNNISYAKYVSEPVSDRTRDVLNHYNNSVDESNFKNLALRSTYNFLFGLGMMESNGRPFVGRDILAKLPPDANNVETGLYQVSYDQFNRHETLKQRYDFYKSNPQLCKLDVFMNGKPARITEEFSEKDKPDNRATTFQKFTKDCPAFATDFAAILLRANANYSGPIREKKVEYRNACFNLLKEVETLTKCN